MTGVRNSRITPIVIGAFVALIALCLLGAGGTGLWATWTQREEGYVTTDAHTFSAAGSALTTERTHLGSAGVEWLYAPGILGKVRVRVTPADGARPVFVGIARSIDVDRYLGRVGHTVISDFWSEKLEQVVGGPAASAPGEQRFWVASDSGSGPRSLVWKPRDGSWTVVVMNADGQPGIDVRTDLGARFPAAVWIALGLLIGGAVFMAGAVLLVRGALRKGG
jgi:hypothetical protein